MKIVLTRLKDDTISTIGTLSIDGKFKCFTLEDTHNIPKVHGESRIPAGEYRIDLRTDGKMTHRYASKFEFHKGMLWLRAVPNFEYVYIHIGNREDDTDGCILLGRTCSSAIGSQAISGSTLAYVEYYQLIANAILSGESVTIEIKDE